MARYGILVMRGSRGMDPSSLVLLDFDGRNELDLESTATQTCRPTWSPDGERLAYCRDAVVEDQDVSRQPNYQEVVVRPVSGVGRRVLAIGKNPNFAPDGKSVVFSADKHLWAVSVDGSGRRQLTSGSGTEDFPAWSPDGRYLAYVGTTSTLRAVPARRVSASSTLQVERRRVSPRADTVPIGRPTARLRVRQRRQPGPGHVGPHHGRQRVGVGDAARWHQPTSGHDGAGAHLSIPRLRAGSLTWH